MEIPYKARFVSVLGHPWFTPFSSNQHHRGLKEADVSISFSLCFAMAERKYTSAFYFEFSACKLLILKRCFCRNSYMNPYKVEAPA